MLSRGIVGDYNRGHYVLGAVEDFNVVEIVGCLYSSFPHQATKKLLE